MRSTGHQAGFTLVETLVAFAIFSLSSVAILQTYSTSSRSQARAQASVETSAQLAQLLASAEARFDYHTARKSNLTKANQKRPGKGALRASL